MNESIVVAILSLVGTCVGSVVAVLTSNNLTKYRIEELTKQVERHNEVVERTYRVEEHQAVVDEHLIAVDARLAKLEVLQNERSAKGG